MIIGFHGTQGAGKSTQAELLVSRSGAVRASFATPLKRMVRDALVAQGLTLRDAELHVYGTQEQKDAPLAVLNGRSARDAMKDLGMFYRNTFGEDVWVNMLFRDNARHEHIICDDVRFLSEFRGILQRGGIMVGLMRGSENGPDSDHPSDELRFHECTFCVADEGSPEATAAAVVAGIRQVMAGRVAAPRPVDLPGPPPATPRGE